jgi:nicotinamide-nucleotide amidase
MNLSILAIGDEVVKGKTINTNAAYLARALETYHINIRKQLACIDDQSEIMRALEYLYQDSDIVITSGGLGPTIDDITKESIGCYFDEELVLNEDILKTIEGYFSHLKTGMPKTNIKQAYFLKGSTVIPNNNGTAPGMIYEKEGKMIIVLPGPPKELHPMFENTIIPFLNDLVGETHLIKKYRIMNIGESHIDEIIGTIYQKYEALKIAPYASVGHVDYIITTKDQRNQALFLQACDEFESLLKEYIVGDWSKMINEIIVEQLNKTGLTISTAESCTGGMLSSMLVDVAGSSTVFKEGFVTYSNEAKVEHLNVSREALERDGAVSEQVAFEMAVNASKIAHTNIGLSTTGIAGPSGGTVEKPVGLVYMGISCNGKTKVYKKQFNGDREKVRVRTCLTLLYYLYRDFIKTL